MFADAIRVGNKLSARPVGTSALGRRFQGAELQL